MPDQIFYNGTILTMDPRQPAVEAVAIRGNKIVAMGSSASLFGMARRDTERFDLDGCTLLPGFHDSHVHLVQHGLELGRLKLSGMASLQEALDAVAQRVSEMPGGTWVQGSGFSMSHWRVQHLTREHLDAVAPNHPVFLVSRDHHSAWVNSLALRLASIHAGTPDPENGLIQRDAQGEPTGLLLEHAAHLVARILPSPTEEELASAVHQAGEDLASYGVTTVHTMAYEPAAYWREMALQASSEEYPLRVWACIPQEDVEHAAAIGLATGQGGSFFMIGGAKFFADGALGSLTAWMLEPFDGTPERGVAVHGPEVLAERLPLVIDAGFAPVVHAIGDAANRAVLDALEATLPQWQARGLRPRIEHAQHLHQADLARFARLGVIASMQPEHLVFDARRIHELLGRRAEGAYAIRSLLEHKAHVIFGSDTPVTPPDVLQGLKAACHRLDMDGNILSGAERVTAEQALAAYTREAAFAIGREHQSGQLRPGFDADFVILSGDPRDRLDGLQVEGVMMAGRWTKAFY
jgi:predicted amidohydrolase YtcJ